MAVALRAANGSSSTAGNTVTIPKPSGTLTGDVLIVNLYVDGNGNTPTTTPSGWTRLVTVSDAGGPMDQQIWYKVAGSSEPPNYQWSASVFLDGTISAWSGADGTTPIDVYSSSNNSWVFPSITTTGTGTGEMLVALMQDYGGTQSATNSGWTLAAQIDGGLQYYKSQTGAAGATGAQTFTGSVGSHCGVMLALNVSGQVAGGGGTSYNKTLVETSSGTDSSLRLGSKVATDTQSGTDLRRSLAQRVALETSSTLDTQTKAATHPLVDAASLLDALAKLPAHVFLEWLSAKDGLSTLHGTSYNQSLSDKQSAQDLLVRQVLHLQAEMQSGTDVRYGLMQHLLLDAASSVDLLAKVPAHRLGDWLSALATVQGTDTPGGGNSWSTPILTGATSALDALIRQDVKLTTDQWSAVDLFARTFVATRLLQEAVSDLDSVVKAMQRAWYDGSSTLDLSFRQTQHLQGDLASSWDALVRGLSAYVLDALSGTDTQQKAVKHGLADALSPTDKLVVGRALLLSVLDAMGMVDSVGEQLSKAQGRMALSLITSVLAATLGMQLTLAAAPSGVSALGITLSTATPNTTLTTTLTTF